MLFAGLMFLTVIVFSIMAQFYEFIDPDKWKTPDPDEKKQLPSEKGEAPRIRCSGSVLRTTNGSFAAVFLGLKL